MNSERKGVLTVICLAMAVTLFGRDFDVRDFGAKGDGKTKDTVAIQSAIDACHAKGGGRVVLDGGVYLSAPISLKSAVELHLDASATLLGSPDLADYPNRIDIRHVNLRGCPRWRNTALVIADECENIAITGRGTIDGSGRFFVRKKSDQANSRYPGYPYERIAELTNSLPRTVFFAGCRNVRVTDVTLVGLPAGWGFLVNDCDYVHFDRVNVLADVRFPNNDGIHVNCSRDVTISNCILETGDDAIVVRANSSSLAVDKPCERVVVANCTMKSWCSGVRIGWVNDGVIRNCLFSNLVMADCTKGISIQMGEPASRYDIGREASLYENIEFSHIIMDGIYTHPLMIDTVENPKTKIDRVRNIRFSHIHARSLCKPYVIGRSSNPFRDFRFDNCVFEALGEKDLPMRWDLHGCSSYNRKGDVPPKNCVGFVADEATLSSWPDVKKAMARGR